MTQKEVEEKILELLTKIRSIYLEYNPEGKQLNIAVSDESVFAFNDYWDKEKDFPIDCYRRISE